jgi:hypothetical protein
VRAPAPTIAATSAARLARVWPGQPTIRSALTLEAGRAGGGEGREPGVRAVEAPEAASRPAGSRVWTPSETRVPPIAAIAA